MQRRQRESSAAHDNYFADAGGAHTKQKKGQLNGNSKTGTGESLLVVSSLLGKSKQQADQSP